MSAFDERSRVEGRAMYERWRDAVSAEGGERPPAWPYLPEPERGAWAVLAAWHDARLKAARGD